MLSKLNLLFPFTLFSFSNLIEPSLLINRTTNNIEVKKQKNPELICFTRQVLPILKTNCAISKCHNSDSRMAGYAFTSYPNITERGVYPKKPEKSPIYQVLLPAAAKPMPPKPHNPIPNAQIEIIRLWIEQGAKPTQCP